MLFHEIQTKPAVLADGHEERELRLRISALLVWLAVTVFLIVAAIYTYNSGWSDGARQILNIASSIAGGGGLGIYLGERRAAKEAGVH